MEKTLTSEERIAIIRHAHQASQSVVSTQSVNDFVADVKSDQVFQEHGLLNTQREDVEDEKSLIDHDPSAESIDEEDEGFEMSPEMREVQANN